jgi:arylsulfatase A-like enzyme
VRFAIAFLVVGLSLVTTLARAEQSGPNIVAFVADDLGWADVPWHGSAYTMPNLARLAEQSLRLESHYVHPMCSPTRSAFMTGRYASRFGVTAAQNPRCLPWNTVTLASALKTAGYDTAITGKWHLGSRPEEGPQKFGFDHGYGSLAGGVGPLDHRYKEGEFTRTWHRNGVLLDEEGHVTDLIAREATQWLRQRGERPFFLYVPFTAIHVPMLEAEKWLEANAHISDPGQRLRAACATHMDDAVGQILAGLDDKKLRDNTIVLFFGDNGAHPPSDNQGGAYPGMYEHLQVGNTNAPLRGHKSSVYEGGIRVPAFISSPGKLAAGETWSPLHAVDWMPTLCARVGAKPAGDLKWDGIDIWPTLTRSVSEGPPTQARSASDGHRREAVVAGSQGATPPRTIYSAAPNFRAQMLRHGDWKLIVTAGNEKKNKAAEVELFNLADDLSESKNLAPSMPEKVAEMKQRLFEASRHDRDAVAND